MIEGLVFNMCCKWKRLILRNKQKYDKKDKPVEKKEKIITQQQIYTKFSSRKDNVEVDG